MCPRKKAQFCYIYRYGENGSPFLIRDRSLLLFMIVVTGAPRTGTSLMMQTLIKLGIRSPAPPFLSRHEKIKDYNLKGFYELYDEVIQGVNDNRYKGRAVKLWPPILLKSDMSLVEKMIVCKRDPLTAVRSYRPIHGILKEPHTPEDVFFWNSDTATALSAIVPSINMDYKDMVEDPKCSVWRLVEFLEIPAHPNKILEAIKNIKVCHSQQQQLLEGPASLAH